MSFSQGMSELSPIGTLNTDTESRSGSVGPLVSSTFAKVVNENGQSLPAYEDGELLIQGPQVMKGYLEDPEKTAECFSESRWLRTGDVAHYDSDGYIYITDRIKELIKVNGFPVAPAELEALLLTHPAVADVAVIGVPDDKSQEAPRAYIVKTEGVNIGEEEIYEWVSERVVHYKRIRGIAFVSTIPKSASGKILRRILRDDLEYAV
jgi:4-coumarate--CoA ligase